MVVIPGDKRASTALCKRFCGIRQSSGCSEVDRQLGRSRFARTARGLRLPTAALSAISRKHHDPPASALPVEAPPAFLGVSHSATGKLWRDRLDARGRGAGARDRAALSIAGNAGAGDGRARCRDRCGDGFSRSDHPQADARSLHRDADGGGGQAHRRRRACAARRSRSSATTMSTARPRRRCSPGICAIAGSIR